MHIERSIKRETQTRCLFWYDHWPLHLGVVCLPFFVAAKSHWSCLSSKADDSNTVFGVVKHTVMVYRYMILSKVPFPQLEHPAQKW